VLHGGDNLREAVGCVEASRLASLAVGEKVIGVGERGEVGGGELHVIGVAGVA